MYGYARATSAWLMLCVAALSTGGAFSILFTGETYGGFDGGFTAGSFVATGGGGAFWTMIFAAFAAVLVGSSGGYRFTLLLPIAVLYALLFVYGLPPVLPLRGWSEFAEEWQELFFTIGMDVYMAANTMYAEPIPYDLAPGLLVVLIPIVMIVVTFATSATLYEESPVISVAVLGLTLGVLSTISFEDGAGPFFTVFLLAATALLLFSGVAETREGEQDSRGAGEVARSGVVAGVAVVMLVLALPKGPFSEQTFSSGVVDWTRIGASGTSRLDVRADVGDYLTYGRGAELLRVRSSDGLYWRAGTLDYFDGYRWSDTTDAGLDYGEEISPGVPTRVVRQSVEILNAETDRVFGGYRITETSLPSYAVEENSDGSWTADEKFIEGSEYRVLSQVPQPTEAQLQGAGTNYPEELEEKFRQLPENLPPIVDERAREIQNLYSPETPYEKARAIERYLIYDGEFTYNLDVNYRRGEELERFLGDEREGFCTQFATSMALLAREMDLPSRVVYGSTSGEEIETGEYVVTGANMHTWVEIYFPGVGWYPFEPTPGFSVPAAMEANAPQPVILASPRALEPRNPALRQRPEEAQQAPEQEPDEAPRRTERNNTNSSGGAFTWPIYALLGALFVCAVPLTKRALLARGRPEDLYRDLIGRLRDVLPPGGAGGGAIADSPALTPSERILFLAGAADLDEAPFREFARAYSEYLYSTGGRRGAGRRVSSAYRRALCSFQNLPLWRRALGALNPLSLVARTRRKLASLRVNVRKSVRGRLRRRH